MFPWMNWTTLCIREEKLALFQTNQVEWENHKPRPTSIQCSSIRILGSSKVLVNFFSQWSTLVKQTDIGMPNTFMFPWMNWTTLCIWEEKSASFQTNQVERENHKPRPTSIQCSSIIFMHFFLLFAKLGGWNCKVSRISWLPSKLIGLLQDTTYTYTLSSLLSALFY